MFSLDALNAAQRLVHADFGPTPAYRWPLLERETGCSVVVKHENHTPTGAFKVRGGLVYMANLKRTRPDVKGVVSATRGNHGQSLAYAGTRHGIEVVIVAPVGNSADKNAAMRALGAEVIEAGRDFDEARIVADRIAAERGFEFVPSFHPDLVTGVATYALELFEAAGPPDVVYVPIGLGSGICGLILTRDLLGLDTEIVGVVAAGAPAYGLSYLAGTVIETDAVSTFADGMACRVPDPDAFAIIQKGTARVVTVSDDEIADAMRLYFRTTHSIAEGAGAAPLAALIQERGRLTEKRTALILCGQNIDSSVYSAVLSGQTPKP